MPAMIRNRTKFAVGVLLLYSIVLMISCASEKPPPALVGDPNDHPESTIPWNRQEKWEIGAGIPSQLGETR